MRRRSGECRANEGQVKLIGAEQRFKTGRKTLRQEVKGSEKRGYQNKSGNTNEWVTRNNKTFKHLNIT